MSSYVYMKILESRPRRYDRGIAWLSFGQADRIKRRIANQLVRPGMRMLDLGCGTATLALLAANKGAQVTGFDISAGMLAVARRKVEAEQLVEKIDLVETGVAGMEDLPAESFELVASTLVFSELSADERRYALRHAFRILAPGGRLVLADEVPPISAWKRVLHAVARLPVALLTFALTQTTTRAVRGLDLLVQQAGFRVETVQRNRLESFLYLVAIKEEP